jgi:hypothetical protein
LPRMFLARHVLRACLCCEKPRGKNRGEVEAVSRLKVADSGAGDAGVHRQLKMW